MYKFIAFQILGLLSFHCACIFSLYKNKNQPEPGYVTPIKGEEYFVAWRSGDLKVTCQVDDKEIYTKASYYFSNQQT